MHEIAYLRSLIYFIFSRFNLKVDQKKVITREREEIQNSGRDAVNTKNRAGECKFYPEQILLSAERKIDSARTEVLQTKAAQPCGNFSVQLRADCAPNARILVRENTYTIKKLCIDAFLHLARSLDVENENGRGDGNGQKPPGRPAIAAGAGKQRADARAERSAAEATGQNDSACTLNFTLSSVNISAEVTSWDLYVGAYRIHQHFIKIDKIVKINFRQLSAVSKRIFATEGSVCSMFQALHNCSGAISRTLQ